MKYHSDSPQNVPRTATAKLTARDYTYTPHAIYADLPLQICSRLANVECRWQFQLT
jgi:hypothetical protein